MVYISSLKKEILPLYTPPYKDEIFSSWYCRLAFRHQVKSETFKKNYLCSNYPLFNRDIDLLSPNDMIDFISNHTPLNKSEINNMFLSSLETYAFEKLNISGHTDNILSIGVNHRKRKRFGVQCCPSCLRKGEPYYRKSWRLITSILCVDCSEFLIDRCPICNATISFHRINMGKNISVIEFKPLSLCHKCNYDLSNYSDQEIPSNFELEYQKYIDNSIVCGFNDYCNYSYLYLEVLLLLARKIRTSSNNKRFKNLMEKLYAVEFEQVNPRRYLNYWDVKLRTKTLPFVFLFLQKDKAEIKELFYKNKVTKSYISYAQNIPFLLENLFAY